MTLDAAVMFGIIPERYKELKLSELDTYFCDGQRLSGTGRRRKSPCHEKNGLIQTIIIWCLRLMTIQKIALSGYKFIDEYEEAKSLGIETKPVITGS